MQKYHLTPRRLELFYFLRLYVLSYLRKKKAQCWLLKDKNTKHQMKAITPPYCVASVREVGMGGVDLEQRRMRRFNNLKILPEKSGGCEV